MLGKNLDNIINPPIYYVNWTIISVEKNYTTTKNMALAMIHVVERFWHYLLGNSFIFYIDHQTLLYLVNKLVVTSRIDC
jgi:hypothetical protein